MEERLFWLGWQYLIPGSGKRLWSLVEHFGSPRAAWEAGSQELSCALKILGRESSNNLLYRKAQIDPAAELAKLESKGFSCVCYNEPEYPQNLLEIFDPPPAIFIAGNLKSSDNLAVAVVGSRRPSPYGLTVAEKLGGDLANAGFTVVSGMARGIDSAAHKGALMSCGRTIAVLGSGLDVIYPRENTKLYQSIIDNGAVISEFPLGTKPEPWHFPARNRIISGLSKGTVVVEASEKSGALITADFSLEQGRDVMAVPGQITNPLSRGPHKLIKQGAKLVESVDDVIEELGLNMIFNLKKVENNPDSSNMNKDENALYCLLTLDPVSLDELIVRSGFSAQKTMAALISLELKGLARQIPGKLYIKADCGLF